MHNVLGLEIHFISQKILKNKCCKIPVTVVSTMKYFPYNMFVFVIVVTRINPPFPIGHSDV